MPQHVSSRPCRVPHYMPLPNGDRRQLRSPSSRGPAVRIEVPRRRPAGIRLTPLIDVVFILLLFFMLASSFLDWRAFDLALPPADATPDSEIRPIVIEVEQAGQYAVAGESVEPDALVERVSALRADAPERPLVVRSVGDTPVRATVQALDRLRAGGIESVSLAAADS